MQNSSHIITNIPTVISLLAGCPSCHPTNGVKTSKAENNLQIAKLCAESVHFLSAMRRALIRTLGVFEVGPRCRPLATSAPRQPLLANPNLFRNPNMVFESTYLCTATTKSLFPTAPEWSIPRSTEMESLIDSSTYILDNGKATTMLGLKVDH